MIKNKKRNVFFAFFFIFFFFLFAFFKLFLPQKARTAALTNASATLSNPRFSYRAGAASGTTGSSTVTIDSSGNADNDTNHLFPKDTICFTNQALSGCIGNKTYNVANIVNSTTFNITSPLTNDVDSDGYVIATQSGSLTITFTTTNEIPSNGDILITIPAVNETGKTNDGFPDTSSSSSTNGFDINGIQTTDISITGCTDANWTVAAITPGDAINDHTIRIDRSTSSCPASTTITITIDSSPGIINPAPTTSHTQGVADTYQINIKTRDGSDYTLDQADVSVSPIEGVLISATVDETLSFSVAGVSADSGTYCGVTRTSSTPDTTATSIPWGTLTPTYSAATHNTQQLLTVSTNADNGYKVYIEENDQMGKDGKTCTGSTAGETDSCIPDTTCNAVGCTHTSYQDWGSDPSSYPGLGYSLQNATGTDAKFQYNTGGATFNAKQMADQEAGESRSATDAEIMTNSGPVDSSSIYVCFRIDITATQPAGYYFNKVKYTAVPTF
ncbi:MAG: hypothetical protein NC913_03805 [Candidatus Omnitrophica bacterium]|nr:hypothetical protein [Candidatus Omnitrophota bacterium]